LVGGISYLILKSLEAILSFLTILPIVDKSTATDKPTNLSDIYHIAKNMYLFPVAGAIIGILIGSLAYGLFIYVQPALLGLIITSALIILTGASHVDALADFADGLMVKGGKELRHKAMQDPGNGSAGIAAIVLYITGMIIAISSFSYGFKLMTGIIVAEVIAKYVMALEAFLGRSAWQGLSSPFTAAMKDKRKMLSATALMFGAIWISGYVGFLSLGISVALAFIIQHIANRSFGGISGDVIGASNEITRLASLIVLSSVTI
jgi:adenosylcobinamide-GDP ribazoletransferase